MRRHVKYRQFHVCDAQLQSILLYPGYLWGVEGGSVAVVRGIPAPILPRRSDTVLGILMDPIPLFVHNSFLHSPTDPSIPPRTSTLGEKEQSSMYFRNDGKGIFSDMYRILLAALQYRALRCIL